MWFYVVAFFTCFIAVYAQITTIFTDFSTVQYSPTPECGFNNIITVSTPPIVKYYHESCDNDTQCYQSPTAMVCLDNLCECTEDYLVSSYPPDKRHPEERTCTLAPSVPDFCEEKCRRPSECLLAGDKKICQCVDPYYADGFTCILDCNDDEVYDPNFFKCIPKCKATEVRVNDTCLPLVDLGQPCKNGSQCLAQFSICKSKICTCLDGFEANGTLCVSPEYSCPAGDALKYENGTPQFCYERSIGTSENQSFIPSSCPTGYFCLLESPIQRLQDHPGYCCPKNISLCPVGVVHPTLKCNSTNQCPDDSYYCNEVQYGSYSTRGCCPRPCDIGLVAVGTECLPKVANLDSPCSNDEQCSTKYAICQNGKCKCGPGAFRSDNLLVPNCVRQCQFDEVHCDDQCLKRVKLNGTCTREQGYLCPENAFCNSQNRCTCQCASSIIAPGVCGPQPLCVEGTTFTTPVFQAAPIQYCPVKDAEPPAAVNATVCPPDYYCAFYMSHFGICCPKPKRHCPYGTTTSQNDSYCDLNNPLSCGSSRKQCYKYMFPVDEFRQSRNYTLCCPDT